MTATANLQDQEYIKDSLGLKSCRNIAGNPDRKNIYYEKFFRCGQEIDSVEGILYPIGKDGNHCKGILKEIGSTDVLFVEALRRVKLPLPEYLDDKKLTVEQSLALFKSGDKSNASNYRPITILPTISKVLEKAVHSQVYRYLIDNKILTPRQFGFRRKLSTEIALAHFTDTILANMDKGLVTGAVFLDLAKAFDTVDHSLLFEKLASSGLSNDSVNWFKSYLSNRNQLTALANTVSSFKHVPVGVPQGSVLGPLLFLIFVNDLPYCINHCEISLYADDTVIYLSSNNACDLEMKLNSDLKYLCRWFNDNLLTLNVSKKKRRADSHNKKKIIVLSSSDERTVSEEEVETKVKEKSDCEIIIAEEEKIKVKEESDCEIISAEEEEEKLNVKEDSDCEIISADSDHSSDVDDKTVKYYDDNPNIPIFISGKYSPTSSSFFDVLVDSPNLKLVCTKLPSFAEDNLAFVISCKQSHVPLSDISCDGHSGWVNDGVRTFTFLKNKEKDYSLVSKKRIPEDKITLSTS
ncbi:Hypothetical predicted protein [Paramuricea clavata]|uniref:Uncharacterized protein n=2 Tax=Paramuricea clavata TaxID=317549 RepID=A0A6S7FSF3_PARCT|nr:Hypothetical predicted protein [Paramuricea clavata]